MRPPQTARSRKGPERFDLEAFKRNHPLAEVVTAYTTLRRSGERLYGRCPFHDDRRPSFSVHLPSNTWSCYAASCGLYGDVIDLVGFARHGQAWSSRTPEMWWDVIATIDAGALPARKQAIPASWRTATEWPTFAMTPEIQSQVHLAARVYHTRFMLDQRPSSPYAYMRDARHVSDGVLRRTAVGYCDGASLIPALSATGLSLQLAVGAHMLKETDAGVRERMAGRIVFVDWQKSGQVLHMIGRAWATFIWSEAPKYLAQKGVDKPLHGYARLDKRASQRPVLIVESPPDRLTALDWGYDCIALCGARMRIELGALLSKLERPLVAVPHNDAGGQGLEAARSWFAMSRRSEALAMLPAEVKDLNEFAAQPGARAYFADSVRRATAQVTGARIDMRGTA